MSDRVTCHHCGVSFKIESRSGGKLICPFCSAALTTGSHGSSPGSSGIHGLASKGSSLATHVPMAPCPSCGKNNLAGIPVCYHCGVAIPSHLEDQGSVPAQ